MKYIHFDEPGPAENMVIAKGEMPQIGRGELRIRVAYAGVNRPDILQRAGIYPPPANASPILGLECSGWVDEIGEDVEGFKRGQEVCALLAGGGYAEYVKVDARHALPIPKSLGLREAAGLAETFFTVWSNVFDRAGLQSGENFLVHGGASGIGTTAIQMAKAMGANVWATAGTDKKCAACEALGAIAINYNAQDFLDYFQSQKLKMNVILDMVGGDYIEKNIRALALDGRLVNIAYLQGSTAAINFMPIMLKRLTITGSTLRPQSDEAKGRIALALYQDFWPLIDKGAISPVIDKIYALDDVRDAHNYIESNKNIGKILLKIHQD